MADPNLKATEKRARGPGKAARRASGVRAAQVVEDDLGALAAAGKLAGAGRAAVRAQRAAGLAVTYKRGDKIVREFPDGRREVIGTIAPRPRYTPAKGVSRIGAK